MSYLPEKVSWFRLPEYVKDLLNRVLNLEAAPVAPYTVLRGLWTQTGTNLPVFTVLENTSPYSSFDIQRYGAGGYNFEILGGTDGIETSTIASIESIAFNPGLVRAEFNTNATNVYMFIETFNAAGTNVDNQLLNTPMEFKFYG